ncbi:MAG: hypothetical protein ABJC39_05000 [Chloroflexota bacterium]
MEDPPTAPYSPPPAEPGPPVTPPPATPPPPGPPPPPDPTPAPGPTPPSTAWREPPWIPPRADRGPNVNMSLVFGVIILLVGLWFFASRTLGLALPDIHWGQLWPLILIGLGAWIVYGAMRRNR